jgi:hypothetical protein
MQQAQPWSHPYKAHLGLDRGRTTTAACCRRPLSKKAIEVRCPPPSARSVQAKPSGVRSTPPCQVRGQGIRCHHHATRPLPDDASRDGARNYLQGGPTKHFFLHRGDRIGKFGGFSTFFYIIHRCVLTKSPLLGPWPWLAPPGSVPGRLQRWWREGSAHERRMTREEPGSPRRSVAPPRGVIVRAWQLFLIADI